MYVARQPIFKTNMEVYGYELLYRNNLESKIYDGTSSTQATASVISELYESGYLSITNQKRAFINFDEILLMNDFTEIIEPNEMVIEILETAIVTDALIERIIDLKEKGYLIALDDFNEDINTYPLTTYADIIKYDLIETPLESIEQSVKYALKADKILLAEKIETMEEFVKAKEMGFNLFQGFFFSKPKIISKSASHISSITLYLEILKELRNEEPSYQIIAEIIEKDVSLAYRLMKIVNKRSGDDLVYSIKRALTYLGFKEIERWINILMVQSLSKNKPMELTAVSLIRSKFCENTARHSKNSSLWREASMMGLFSTLDAILDQSICDVIDEVALSQNIKLALCKQEGPLSGLYELVLAYETGEFSIIDTCVQKLGLDQKKTEKDYIKAVEWANQTLKLIF